MTGQILCWVVAIVLFVVGAFWNPRPGWSLMSVGLAFGFLGFLIPLL